MYIHILNIFQINCQSSAYIEYIMWLRVGPAAGSFPGVSKFIQTWAMLQSLLATAIANMYACSSHPRLWVYANGSALPFCADDDGGALQAALQEISGQRTVPNVFVKSTHIGGNDDLQAAVRSGSFQKMLK
ncbi:hypothetical protein SARC_03235 [Sphaeroforma arctica JP610]|uniref:Glutaredoxin domain-containing protein n=1 Tax=Sphaeroforma arctica JP610 TaxID=667725 RepID=A0A0L0G6E9_9EUKA|nr:hypothetical protein SARC_03235 [Sphaeroforma arctica JP610]KNC84562.1 hypothetical protein SARC_03235 [Sphaeroforma arctica JP610]|eukprot:XP_014158464.1 hypothetical protein SARC_03235 [Sphaeroforma arctica JP610]